MTKNSALPVVFLSLAFGLTWGLLIMRLLPEDYFATRTFDLCLYKLLTGHECWGCGTLRGLSHLVYGHFGAAWRSNPLVYIWVSAAVLASAWSVPQLINRKSHD